MSSTSGAFGLSLCARPCARVLRSPGRKHKRSDPSKSIVEVRLIRKRSRQDGRTHLCVIWARTQNGKRIALFIERTAKKVRRLLKEELQRQGAFPVTEAAREQLARIAV